MLSSSRLSWLSLRRRFCYVATMHLRPVELDAIQSLSAKGKNPAEVQEHIQKMRNNLRGKPDAPHVNNIRRVMKGLTYKQARKETRGRPRVVKAKKLAALFKARRELLRKAKKESEVTHTMIKKRARVKASNSVISRRFSEQGVKARPLRKKPNRKLETKRERVALCKKWVRHPKDYFRKKVDLVIDNKTFEAPGTPSGRSYQKQTKVRFTHRTRGEGLHPLHTKPDQKRHRKNLGAGVKIMAGLSDDRVVMWEDVGANWNGEKAAKMYQTAVQKALLKCRPRKKPVKGKKGKGWLVLEDNDPAGYKSNLAKAAKKIRKRAANPAALATEAIHPVTGLGAPW